MKSAWLRTLLAAWTASVCLVVAACAGTAIEPMSRGGDRSSSSAAAGRSSPLVPAGVEPPGPRGVPASAAAAFGTPATPSTGSSPPSAAMLNEADLCNAQSYDAQRAELDIYMMIDDSGSMIPWWPSTLDSLNQFFSDPSSAGIHVGLQLFGTICDVAHYSTPLVPIAALPGNADALRQAFPLIPTDETATLPALQGAVTHARAWATNHPDRTVVVLLVTDGLPEECGSTVENVAAAAREGFSGSPSVKTFVVGIGDLAAIDQFAQAGGTGKALQTSPGAAAELVAALNQVRSSALPCEYPLPGGEAEPLQADRINLRYTPANGAASLIGAVPDSSRCDATLGGWYFDDPAKPTRAVVCPASCQQLNAGGRLQVLVGCPTKILAPS